MLAKFINIRVTHFLLAIVSVTIFVGLAGLLMQSEQLPQKKNTPLLQPSSSLHQTLLSLPDRSKVVLAVGNIELELEVVNTPASIVQGLSDRDTIGSDGMLFVFASPSKVGFWMKRMQFDLDLIWIQSDTIIGITPQVPHPISRGNDEETLPVYYPPQPVTMVLEVPAGFVEQHQIISGAEVTFRSML